MKKCATCGELTNRHAAAKYCWPCSKTQNIISNKRSSAKIKAKKDEENLAKK
jgi:ribosomal protein L32